MIYRRSYIAVVLFSLILMFLVGCKDEEKQDIQDYCTITKFTIGSLKRTVVKRTGHGTTNTSVTTIYTAGWKFAIDQINNQIYNRDSLPTGSSRRTLLDITYKGVSIVYREHNASAETPWVAYAAADSVTIPEDGGLDFMVNGTGGISRVYHVQFNVHKQEGTDWQWSNRSEGLEMSQWVNARLVTHGANVLLYATSDGENWELWKTKGSDAWQKHTISGLPSGAKIEGVVAGKKLYVCDDDGMVWTSTDGAHWTAQGLSGTAWLVGVSDNRLYAIRDNILYSAALSDGAEWEEEVLDDRPSAMTDFSSLDSVRFISMHRDNSLKRIFMVGTLKNPTSSDLTALEWSKMWTADGDELERSWIYYTPAWENLYGLPAMKPLGVVKSDNNLVAFGGARTQKDDIKPLNFIFVSVDCGVTWHTDDLHYLPDELWGKNCSWLSAAADAAEYVWIVARVNGTETYVMRGRQYSLGFAK